MKKIAVKKILVPVDFTATSENAVNAAISIAKVIKAEIILLHVLDINRDQFSLVSNSPSVSPKILEITRMVKARLEEMTMS